MEKKLYSIYEFSLPVAIPLKVIGIFLLVGVPWWLLLSVVHFPFGSPWYLAWIIPPAALAWFGSRPIFEGKTLFQYLASRIKFLFENKRYKGITPDLENRQIVLVEEMSFFTLPGKDD